MFKDLMSKFFCYVHVSHTLKDQFLLVIINFYHVFQSPAQTFFSAISAKECNVMCRICWDYVNEPSYFQSIDTNAFNYLFCSFVAEKILLKVMIS